MTLTPHNTTGGKYEYINVWSTWYERSYIFTCWINTSLTRWQRQCVDDERAEGCIEIILLLQ